MFLFFPLDLLLQSETRLSQRVESRLYLPFTDSSLFFFLPEKRTVPRHFLFWPGNKPTVGGKKKKGAWMGGFAFHPL